ncbi:unnamed protein product, partial [marine sediment metagenome]
MWFGDKHYRHCRWCGQCYNATRPIGRDGFCCPKCKQAHYRAYKKYVTQTSRALQDPAAHKVTQKTPGRRRGMIKT